MKKNDVLQGVCVDYTHDGLGVVKSNDFTFFIRNVLKGETEILKVNKEITEKLETTTYYKWYWTTSMFNEYYYNTNDFNTLKFELVLDSKAIFATNPETYIWKTKEVNNLGE